MAGFKDFANGNVLTGDELDGYLMQQTVMRFSSESARDAALAAVLTDGLMAYTTDAKKLWIYESGSWYETFPQPDAFASTTAVSTTSSTFGPGASVLGGTFVAPRSGKVFIEIAAMLYVSSGAGNQGAYIGVEIRSGNVIGSGTVFASPVTTDCLGVGQDNDARVTATRRNLYTGLTPGATYNVRALLAITPANGTVTANAFYRKITIDPVI
jgi:hypothetical protein